MGVFDKMVHAETSKFTALSNGNHLEEIQVEVLEQNSRYVGPNGQLKFKRRRVSAVRDFPTGCGPSSTPFTLPSGPEVQVETCENGDKADDLRGSGIVRSLEAKVKPSSDEESGSLVPGETVAQRDNVTSIDGKQILPSSDTYIGVTKSHQVNRLQLMEVELVEPILTPKDTKIPKESSEPIMLEPVDAQPLGICLPDSEPGNIDYGWRHPKEVGSAYRQNVDSSEAVMAKRPPGKKVSAVRDFPPSMGSKAARLNSVKIRKVALLTEIKSVVQEKSGYEDVPVKAIDKQINSGTQNLTENMVRDIVVYKDQSLGREVSDLSLSKSTSEEDIGLLDYEKGNVAVPKQIGVADRTRAKKQVAKEVDVGLVPSHPGGASSVQEEGNNGLKRVDYRASKILRDKDMSCRSRRSGASNSRSQPLDGHCSEGSHFPPPGIDMPEGGSSMFMHPTPFYGYQPPSHPQPQSYPQQPSLPKEPSEEELLQRESRDQLPFLDPSRRSGTQWFSYNQISRHITKVMKANFDRPCYNWSNTDQEVKDRWWKIFIQKYNWNPEYTVLVKSEFEKNAAKRLKSMINEVKSDRNNPPNWIPENVWLEMNAFWNTSKHKEKCDKASKSRKSDRGGIGMASHTAGCKSFVAVYEEMKNQIGTEPSYLELMEKTHKKKTDGSWIDARAEETYKTISDRLSQTPCVGYDDNSKSNQLSQQVKNNVYLETVIPSKGRIYGIGSVIKKMFSTGSSSQSGMYEMQNELRLTKDKLATQKMLSTTQQKQIETQQQQIQTLINIMKSQMPNLDWSSVPQPTPNP